MDCRTESWVARRGGIRETNKQSNKQSNRHEQKTNKREKERGKDTKAKTNQEGNTEPFFHTHTHTPSSPDLIRKQHLRPHGLRPPSLHSPDSPLLGCNPPKRPAQGFNEFMRRVHRCLASRHLSFGLPPLQLVRLAQAPP